MDQFKAELLIPSEENWQKVKFDILRLEHEAFGDHPYSEEELHQGFINPYDIVVLLSDTQTNTIIGFAYTVPITHWEPERYKEVNDIAQVDDIVIAKAFRGKGLVQRLSVVLETEMKKRGFTYFEIQANITNGYAQKIENVYKSRIVLGPKRTDPHHDHLYGARMHFRIKL